ncbi:MAG TPA: AraC family transcriptional regulator ligand-binding domain-containing protein [Polyangiaceae bacterium]|nr:AraC family transcriptional regulator ligand-binding domain-containing protein [Polyangiaceae bacterium]
MPDSGSRERPTYSVKLLKAFLELLTDEYDDIPGFSPEAVESLGERVLIDVSHQALAVAVEATKDPDLGLKAARRVVLGDVGAFYYVVSSSPTVREAIGHASRYTRLINDVLDVRLEMSGDQAVVRMDNALVLPRAAVDFEVAAFFRNHVREWFGSQTAGVTVWFAHQAPADLSEYERTFGPAAVRFSMPFVAFTFDRSLLEVRLKGADPHLHALLVPVAERSLGKLAEVQSVTGDVRRLVRERLAKGAPEIADVAADLAMSMRTLSRRLEAEGTTFRDVVDDVRRELAITYVGGQNLGFSEVADRLGFSHVAAFHRAFRRWTGQTPLNYRRHLGR